LSVGQTETVNFELVAQLLTPFVTALTGLAEGTSLYTVVLACFASTLICAIAVANTWQS